MPEMFFLILIGLIILMISLYFKTRKQLMLRHQLKCNSLETKIESIGFQLEFRNKGLNNYNFQTYNLKDSLLVQSEINLN